nr:type II toxin-antitoxin system HipA family toxin [Desulfobulbaceae bacterium]
MIKLNVWLTLDETATLRVGELIAADPDAQKGGAIQGQFRYTNEYLNWPKAFPLDPIHLPLAQTIFDANRPRSGIHGVFEDSLPDDWGRKILVRKYNIPRNEQRPPQLLRCLAGDGMGALSYSEDDLPPKKKEPLGSHFLEVLKHWAEQFEKDATVVGDELALLFQAGSSPGGARPKALIQDGGKPYIAKFRSIKDQFDVVSLEAATMALAVVAGVDVAPSRHVYCGGQKVLLVERFDVQPQEMRRNHVVTLQTLLGADDYYHLGYRDLAGIVRKVSMNPGDDLRKLFKQLLFNVLIGNTDDHLKNFSMTCDGASWRLSPAYDLVPNVGQNREHVLSINHSFMVPDRSALLQEAKYFGIKQQRKANEIIESMVLKVSGWEKTFHKFDVPHEDMEIIGRDIEGRLAKMCS